MKAIYKNILLTAFLTTLVGTLTFGQKMQFWTPNDQRALNRFETTKADTVPFEGMKVRVGGAFTQQYQNISHSNLLWGNESQTHHDKAGEPSKKADAPHADFFSGNAKTSFDNSIWLLF